MDDSTAISTGGPSAPPRHGICWECNGIPSSCFFEPVQPEKYLESGKGYFQGTWDEARKGCALCDSLVTHLGVSDGCGGDGGDSSGSAKETVRCHPSTIEYAGKEFLCFEVDCKGRTVVFFESSILRSVPAYVHDMKLAKNWITRCLQSHEEHCGHGEFSGFSLRVIDCNSRELCEIIPGTPYVCLSYVWGNASVDDETCADLSRSLPKTIEDSIWVTLQLGYSYLWVDRYCIDQHNNVEKQHLITNMGEIYKGAALTIIAAEGDSPHGGLPGINGTPRRQQYSHTIGTSSQKIIGIDHPYEEIRYSVWNSRGWTYQELILSRRRLVFTRSQMYFQCKVTHGIESLSSQAIVSPDGPTPDNGNLLRAQPNDHRDTVDLHEKTDKRRYTDMDKNLHRSLRAFYFIDTESTVQTLYSQIRQYYLRRLSFREDNIKAFTGIINAFKLQRSTDRLDATHVSGLPIFYSQKSSSFSLLSEKKGQSTVFTPTSTFVYGFFWYLHRQTGSRNDTAMDTMFPSWSWTSAKGCQEKFQGEGLYWLGLLSEFSCAPNLQVWLHDESKGSLELDHYINTYGQEDGKSLVPMISIRTWVVSCNAELRYPGHRYYDISGFQGDQTFSRDFPDTPPSDNLVAIYIGRVTSNMWSNDEELTESLLLIVEKVDVSTWRRIGIWECVDKKVSQAEDNTLTCLNRIQPGGSWNMRTMCLV